MWVNKKLETVEEILETSDVRKQNLEIGNMKDNFRDQKRKEIKY